jgi:hypothetical protein
LVSTLLAGKDGDHVPDKWVVGIYLGCDRTCRSLPAST